MAQVFGALYLSFAPLMLSRRVFVVTHHLQHRPVIIIAISISSECAEEKRKEKNGLSERFYYD